MKGMYTAVFTQTEEGTVLIEVPDLDILTEGSDMEDAMKMAKDAIEVNILCLEDENEPIPRSTIFDIKNSTFYGKGESISVIVDFDSDAYRKKLEIL